MRIKDVSILMPDGVFWRGSVEFDEFIKDIKVVESANEAAEFYLIPGVVDIHTHGAVDCDHTDGSAKAMQDIAKFYAENGTTSFLATVATVTGEVLENAMSNIAAYHRAADGARCLGANMEGLFFSNSKRGAHRAELLKNPDIALLQRLNNLSRESIRIVCVAPELDGAMEFIREVSKTSKVSLAHSAADYDTAMKAYSNGATHATHLFNGMNFFLHREPGIVGAAFDSNAFVEVICDGFHLHPAIVRAVFSMFSGRVCLVSDSSRCTGMPDGEYESADMPVVVKDGKVMLKDGSSIAGSSIMLMQGVRKAVEFGIPVADAIMAATVHPARAIGMEDKVGTINIGAYADFLLLDADLNIRKVYIGGSEIKHV